MIAPKNPLTASAQPLTKHVIVGLVAVHLAATLWHGAAHTALGVIPSPAQNVFIYGVITLGPLLAAGLVWTGRQAAGLWVFLLSMTGSLVFGAYYHYIHVSPDNIAHLPAGDPATQAQFVNSSLTIALIELGAALYGAYALGSRRP